MNKQIKKLAKQAGIKFVESANACIALNEDIERFYEMAFYEGMNRGMKTERALATLSKMSQEIERGKE